MAEHRDDPAMTLLRLLAEGAPASELGGVHDPTGEARELALRVRAAFDSRRRREAELTALVRSRRAAEYAARMPPKVAPDTSRLVKSPMPGLIVRVGRGRSNCRPWRV